MAWPEKTAPTIDGSEKRTLGEGVFRNCDGCAETMPKEEFTENREVCPRCGHHHRLDASGWLGLMCDDGSLERWDIDLRPTDPLNFTDGKKYSDRVSASQKKTGALDAIRVLTAVPVPEPSTFVLVGFGLGAVGLVAHRCKKIA